MYAYLYLRYFRSVGLVCGVKLTQQYASCISKQVNVGRLDFSCTAL